MSLVLWGALEWIVSFKPHNSAMAHFTDEETEAQEATQSAYAGH